MDSRNFAGFYCILVVSVILGLRLFVLIFALFYLERTNMSWVGWEVQERKNMLNLFSMKNVKTINLFYKRKFPVDPLTALPDGGSSSFEGPSSQVSPTLC